MKINLINFNYNNNLTLPLIEKNIAEYFTLSVFDQNKNYDKQSTIFSANFYQYQQNKDAIDKLIADGYKIIFENLHEAQPILQEYLDKPNLLFMTGARRQKFIRPNVVQIPLYFWYCESKAWAGSVLDYKNIPRINNFKKKFLLMMNYDRPFRTEIHNKFSDIVQDAVYSFVDKGIRLEGDIDRTTMYWDRHINPNWFNTTQFSVVVETQMDNWDLFMTEKTMKPLALQHPFISLGCVNTLKAVKQAGFELFDNLFDLSYDSVESHFARIDHVYQQVKNYNLTGYDQLTMDKIAHNYDWFYNSQEVDRRFRSDVIDPILAFFMERK
jgi:hypothetical protein